MAHKSNNRPNNARGLDKRQARKEKSDRNMNRAIILLIGGLIAEWYLLMMDRYYASGKSKLLDRWFNYLGVMRWVGLALLLAGVAMVILKKKNNWKGWVSKLGAGIATSGAFFAITSEAARHVYPTSVSVMCVLVPVALVLGVIYLFYQAEFSVQATALAAALFALALLNRSGTKLVKAFALASIVAIVLILGAVLLLKKNQGVFKAGEKSLRLFPEKMDYSLTLGIPALCAVSVVAALVKASVAFYAIWVLAILAFVLAVYYTIKLM